MNIEDVKQLSNKELCRRLSKLTGYTDKTVQRMKDVGSWSSRRNEEDVFRPYTHNLDNAREAQAKAIKVNANKYVGTLYDVMYFDEGVPPDPTDNFQEVTYRGHGVAYMLQATPRQVCEAAYLMLMEVQSNGRI
jgi:hypothetical protein